MKTPDTFYVLTAEDKSIRWVFSEMPFPDKQDIQGLIGEALAMDDLTDVSIIEVSTEVPARDVTRDKLEEYIYAHINDSRGDLRDIKANFRLSDGFNPRGYAEELHDECWAA